MHGTDARHARRGRPIYRFHDLQQPLTDRQDLALLVGRDRRPEAIHGQLDRLPLIKQSKKKTTSTVGRLVDGYFLTYVR